MGITAADVKRLRDATGQGMMECKKALEEAGGDQEKAIELLRKKGLKTAEKRVGRATANGVVLSYIHHNSRIGVLVQVNCETDFVARNEEFQQFVKDLCMHVCAYSPLAVSREQVDAAVVDKEREILREQVATQHGNKPENVREKILDGMIDKFFAERVLLEQPWIHDEKQTVADVLKALIGKVGENMQIVRFARLDVSDPVE